MRLLVTLIITFLLSAFVAPIYALDCPPFPQQASKDWEVEVNAAIAKIGPVKGGELSTRTKNATNDLMSKLPDAGRLYLEQMMYAGYCTALRDDKSMSEQEKAKLLRTYATEVRKAIAQFSSASQKSQLPQRRPAEIKLVDLSINDRSEVPKLDIKVRNSSDEVVFIKRAEIEVVGQWDIPQPGSPSAVPISATYDVKVSNKIGYKVRYNISQELRPNSADRFEIAVASDHSLYPFVGIFAYLLKVKLIYNENNRVLELPPVLVHIQSEQRIEGYSSGRESRELVERNKSTAQALLKSVPKGTIAPDGLLDAVKTWADADLEVAK